MKQPARARWIWLFAMLLFTGVLILASWDRGVAIDYDGTGCLCAVPDDGTAETLPVSFHGTFRRGVYTGSCDIPGVLSCVTLRAKFDGGTASALSNGWKFVGATLGLLVTNVLDRKYIRFETQAVWWAQIIKLAVGFGLLLAIRAGLKAPLIALCGGAAEIAGGIRYLLIVLFAGCVWPLTFWGFSRLGRR